MTYILHLDTSPRAEQSHSRMLAREFLEKWRDRHPQTKIIYKDLGLNLIPYIVRPRGTFAVDTNGFKGLVTDKKMLVITARGSDFSPGSDLAPLDFQEPFLRTIFNFIGISDIQFINANKLNSNIREQSLAEARMAIQELIARW